MVMQYKQVSIDDEKLKSSVLTCTECHGAVYYVEFLHEYDKVNK